MLVRFKRTVIWYDLTWSEGQVVDLNDDAFLQRFFRAGHIEKVEEPVAPAPPSIETEVKDERPDSNSDNDSHSADDSPGINSGGKASPARPGGQRRPHRR